MRIRSASWLFSAQVFSRLLSFPISILLARTIGPAGKGELTMIQLMATMGAALVSLGMPTALSYLVARGDASGRDAVRLAVAVSLLGGAVVVIVAVFFGPAIAQSLLKTSSVALIYAGAIIVVPVLVVQILSAVLIGLGRPAAASMLSAGVLVFELSAYVLLLVLRVLTPTAAVGIWAVGVVGAAVVALGLCLGTPTTARDRGMGATFDKAFRYGAAVWATGVFTLLSVRQDVFMVGYLLDTTAVGVYSIAVTFAELTWFIPTSVSGVLMPKIAGEPEGSAELTARVTRTLWPITLAAAAAVLLVAWVLVPLAFGPRFAGALLPLVLILPGVCSMAVAGPCSSYLSGTGHPFDWTKAVILNFVVNISVNLVLIPRMGIAGAGLASTISYSCSAALTAWYFMRRTHVGLAELLVPRAEDLRSLVRMVRETGGAVVRRAGHVQDPYDDAPGVV